MSPRKYTADLLSTDQLGVHPHAQNAATVALRIVSAEALCLYRPEFSTPVYSTMIVCSNLDPS